MGKKKIIWIINQTAGKLDSGWGERHYYLSLYWVKKGYEVKIISGSHNHLFIQQPEIKKQWFTTEKVEDGIEFCWIKIPQYSNAGIKKYFTNLIFTFKLFFLTSKILKKPSIILVSSMPIFPIINGYFFKRKFRAQKLIIEVRDLWPLTPVYLKKMSKNHPLILIIGWFEKFAYKKSDKIVSLLPNSEGYITSISKNKSKFIYIPNGIDEELIGKKELNSSIKNQIPKNKFIVGYAGTIGLANAMEYFVEASLICKNNNIHYVIVGDGPLKEQFKLKVKKAINITFIDKIDKHQMQSLLKYFDVCYVGRYKSPLYQHGVSYNKYFDYMLAKKPILESSEYIKSQVEVSGCGIIVKPECPAAINKGINQFYKLERSDLNKMGEKGYGFIKKNHDFNYLSSLYLKLFE